MDSIEKKKPKGYGEKKAEREEEMETPATGKVIAIMGESGSGKTTSMRNLDPTTTYYIDCDKKGLSWKGWKQQYNKENKNYKRTSESETISELITHINNNVPRIKVIVIDTINGIMIDDEFKRMNEKGYDKWQDLAVAVYNLISICNELRNDLTVIFIAHSQTDREDDGYKLTRIKTSGRKLDKIVLESKFTTVLLARCINGKYVFETSSNNSTAKSPMGAFDSRIIDNDIVEVLKALEDY